MNCNFEKKNQIDHWTSYQTSFSIPLNQSSSRPRSQSSLASEVAGIANQRANFKPTNHKNKEKFDVNYSLKYTELDKELEKLETNANKDTISKQAMLIADPRLYEFKGPANKTIRVKDDNPETLEDIEMRVKAYEKVSKN